MTRIITTFQGRNGFLSNAYRAPVHFASRTYPTAWHAFYAQRALNREDHDAIAKRQSWTTARTLSRRVVSQPHWLDTRLFVMEKVLRAKFQHQSLRDRLLLTADAEIIYTHLLDDKFWLANLGPLLMQIRAEVSLAPLGEAAFIRDMRKGDPPAYL